MAKQNGSVNTKPYTYLILLFLYKIIGFHMEHRTHNRNEIVF